MRSGFRWFLLLLLLQTGMAGHAATTASRPSRVDRVVSAPFVDVYDSVTAAILGHGLKISHVIEADQVLASSQADFGGAVPVFKAARIIEFCSTPLSHSLVSADPSNLLLCPFAIAVYELSSHSNEVHVIYRSPLGGLAGDQLEAVRPVESLLKQIVEEGTQWFIILR